MWHRIDTPWIYTPGLLNWGIPFEYQIITILGHVITSFIQPGFINPGLTLSMIPFCRKIPRPQPFRSLPSPPPVRLWSPPQRHTPGHTNWAWSVHVSDVQRPTLDSVPGSISDMEGEPLGGQCVWKIMGRPPHNFDVWSSFPHHGHKLVANHLVLMDKYPAVSGVQRWGPASGSYDQKKQLFAEDVLSKAGPCAVTGSR